MNNRIKMIEPSIKDGAFEQLPDEIIKYLASFLSLIEISRLASGNKRLHLALEGTKLSHYKIHDNKTKTVNQNPTFKEICLAKQENETFKKELKERIEIFKKELEEQKPQLEKRIAQYKMLTKVCNPGACFLMASTSASIIGIIICLEKSLPLSISLGVGLPVATVGSFFCGALGYSKAEPIHNKLKEKIDKLEGQIRNSAFKVKKLTDSEYAPQPPYHIIRR